MKESIRHEKEIAAVCYALTLNSQCSALFELPGLMYNQCRLDDLTRRRPLRMSFEYCKRTVAERSAAGRR